MKVKSYLVTACLAMTGMAMVFSSCSNEEDYVSNSNGIDGTAPVGQQIALSVENENQTTRAGRPLYGSDAADEVKNVKLIIVKEGGDQSRTIQLVKDLKWEDTTPIADGEKKEYVVTLTGDDKLSAGNYTAYAIGYSDDSDYNFPTLTKGSSFNDASLTLTMKDPSATAGPAEEIFAGSTDEITDTISIKKAHPRNLGSINVASDGASFSASVTMRRQVAGIIVYVSSKIPLPAPASGSYTSDYLKGLKLQLVSSDYNDHLVLGHFCNKSLDNRDGENGKIYVVNAYKDVATTSEGEGHVLMETAISDWFDEDASLVAVPTDKDKNAKNGNWILSDSGWKNKYGKEDVITLKNASIYMSAFVMPFSRIADKSTLTLRLVDSNNAVLGTWIVKYPDNATGYNHGYHFCSYNQESNAFTCGTSVDESLNSYSIFRNHLYMVGTKANSGDEGTPQVLPSAQDGKVTITNENDWSNAINMNLQ